MDRHTVILTTDKRQEKLASLLEGEKTSYAWEENTLEKEVCEKVYVLPIPVAKLDRNQEIKKKLKEELRKLCNNPYSKVKVFGGVFNTEWELFLSEYQIPYWDFMKLPEVVEGNGWITAEGVVAELLQYGEYSIYGQKILVTGYGCCGEKIVKILSKLGAEIIVAARRLEVREAIQREGFQAIAFTDMEKMAGDVSAVINTVPAMVVTESCIRRLQPNACIIDIASAPGGTDFEAAKKYGITAKLSLGLPGIYTTTSSAKLLKNAISKYAPLNNEVREGKSWIFQIII
ncbi:MAG: dipicolinate synthase [Agathobacter sp.]|nr:dipicolinate synthase [Agathobacter sp.]